MRLLTRYVLREILQIFLITLTALTGFMILVFAVQEAMSKGLGAYQIIQALPYLLPNALLFAVPGTILFAVSSVYGRMSASNEMSAIKSAGISPLVVLWPAVALAVLLSFTTVWLNDVAMSWGFRGVQRVVLDSIEDIAYSVLRTQKTYGNAAFSVTVRGVSGRTLIAPVFSLSGRGDEGPVTISAKTAQLKSKPGTGEVTLQLYHATVDAPGVRGEYPNEVVEYTVSIAPNGGKEDLSPSHMALRELPEAIDRQRRVISRQEHKMVLDSALGMLQGDFQRLAPKNWRDETDKLQGDKYQLYKMRTEPPRRWANGFSCLCFALVGATMAIRRRNADALTSFFLCFLPILLVYYPLLMYGLDRSKAGVIHPYVVWSANAILVAWGLWLLRRVMRY